MNSTPSTLADRARRERRSIAYQAQLELIDRCVQLGMKRSRRGVGGVNLVTEMVVGTYDATPTQRVEIAVGECLTAADRGHQFVAGFSVRPDPHEDSHAIVCSSIEEVLDEYQALVERLRAR